MTTAWWNLGIDILKKEHNDQIKLYEQILKVTWVLLSVKACRSNHFI